MAKEIIKFEIGMSGTGLSTHHWELDRTLHSDADIRSLVGVIVNGLLQTDEEKELSNRYFKLQGKEISVRWASKKIQATNPDFDKFKIPESFVED